MSFLAGACGDGAVLGRDLAHSTEIPANYLAKILLVLKRAGLVEATRGTGGGYRLAAPPENITLIQVVELFDPLGGMHHCLLDNGRPCNKSQPCPAHDRWKDVIARYLGFLESTTLAEVAITGPSEEEESND